jgi:hypothetical protein
MSKFSYEPWNHHHVVNYEAYHWNAKNRGGLPDIFDIDVGVINDMVQSNMREERWEHLDDEQLIEKS